MTTTTIPTDAPLTSDRSALRYAVATLFVLVLLAGSFVVGRLTTPTHSVRSIVTVPASAPVAPSADVCRTQRPC